MPIVDSNDKRIMRLDGSSYRMVAMKNRENYFKKFVERLTMHKRSD